MASKGYCSNSDVSGWLGLTFTAGQIQQAELLIERVETLIDAYCQRAWLTGALTDEAYYGPFTDRLYLASVPVSAVTAVKGRTGLTATETTLVAGTDYEVRDLTAGLIHLVSPASYDRIRVTYTPVATVPAAIKQVAVELVALGLRPVLSGVTADVRRWQTPDLMVEYATASAGGLPVHLTAILDLYRVPSVA